MQNLENIINEAFENRADFDSKSVSSEIRSAVEQALAMLDSGEGRVAEKKRRRLGGQSVVKKSCFIIVQDQRQPRHGP